MHLIDKLENTKKTYFSFEILPPIKGKNIQSVYKVIDELIEFNPLNINVTYHQNEVIFKEMNNGTIEKQTISKRPGTVAIAAAINHKYENTTVVPHIICGGTSKFETEEVLIDLRFLGIQNILALRGDPPANQRFFKPTPHGNSFANQLVEQISNFNKGIYYNKIVDNETKYQFCIGVAGYPEKHNEAPNFEHDINCLKKKINAGANYIVTQMFFDNQKYFNFVKMCRKANINVPIIPGIKPLVQKRDMEIIPQIFNITIPHELTKELLKTKNENDFKKISNQWAIQQSKELIKFGVPEIHYFTLSNAKNIKNVVKEIF